MRWVVDSIDGLDFSLAIEHDPSCGFYLFVYRGGKCAQDYLQDSLESAIGLAEEKFGVDPSSWERCQS